MDAWPFEQSDRPRHHLHRRREPALCARGTVDVVRKATRHGTLMPSEACSLSEADETHSCMRG